MHQTLSDRTNMCLTTKILNMLNVTLYAILQITQWNFGHSCYTIEGGNRYCYVIWNIVPMFTENYFIIFIVSHDYKLITIMGYI